MRIGELSDDPILQFEIFGANIHTFFKNKEIINANHSETTVILDTRNGTQNFPIQIRLW